ncbi:MAG: ATP synthase F1 subunit gamma [Planctomycetota bacterium]
MPQAREIKRRIHSVRNTQQITRAMKMVAAAKLRKAQMRMLAMRPYDEELSRLIGSAAYDLFGDEHPLFRPREEKRVATLAIAGDKGLCGGFNSSVLRAARAHFASFAGAEHSVWVMGKRAAVLRKSGVKLVHVYQDVFETLSYPLVNDLCETFVKGYLEGTLDSAYLVFNRFVTVMTQAHTVEKVLPIDFSAILAEAKEGEKRRAAEASDGPTRLFYEIEPDPETVVARLMSRRIATRVYRAALESYAAELGARMSAMDAATNNAEDMITSLTMDFNRARQAGITAELLDIVGGAAGLEG